MSKLQVRQLNANFMKTNRDKAKSFITDPFLMMPEAKSTIYDIIKRIEQGKDVTHAGKDKSQEDKSQVTK